MINVAVKEDQWMKYVSGQIWRYVLKCVHCARRYHVAIGSNALYWNFPMCDIIWLRMEKMEHVVNTLNTFDD